MSNRRAQLIQELRARRARRRHRIKLAIIVFLIIALFLLLKTCLHQEESVLPTNTTVGDQPASQSKPVRSQNSGLQASERPKLPRIEALDEKELAALKAALKDRFLLVHQNCLGPQIQHRRIRVFFTLNLDSWQLSELTLEASNPPLLIASEQACLQAGLLASPLKRPPNLQSEATKTRGRQPHARTERLRRFLLEVTL